MKLNLEEQESIAKLKYFFRDYGKYIALALSVLIIVYVLNSVWNWKQQKDSMLAAADYQNVVVAVATNNASLTNTLTERMMQKYPKNEYTAMALMLASKSAKTTNKNNLAEKYLNFIIDKSKDDGLVNVARLRLADVYIDEHKLSLVLPLLLQKHDKNFDALYYSKRGDLHLAQGKLDEARLAYKTALTMAGDNQEVASLINMRLEVLGN